MIAGGIESMAYDPQRIAMDYHIIGFRECAAEVARYLVTIEGMDIQDPLRLRLMSHLQYFVQQRELSAKSCPSSWTPSPAAVSAAATQGYQPNCAVAAPYQSYTSSSSAHSSTSPYVAPIHPYPTLSASPNANHLHAQQQQQQQQHQQQPHSTSNMHIPRSSSASITPASNETIPMMNHANNAQQVVQHNTRSRSAHDQQQAQQQQQQTQAQQQQHYTQEHTHQDHQSGATYIELTSTQAHIAAHRNVTPTVSSSGLGYDGTQYATVEGQEYNPNAALTYGNAANGSKPYRPWGAEMAY